MANKDRSKVRELSKGEDQMFICEETAPLLFSSRTNAEI